MSWVAPDLRLEVSRRASTFIPVVSTVSATSSTTTLVDTAIWTDVSAIFSTGKDPVGMYVYRPSAVADGDRVRRIISVAGSTGTITVNLAWTNAPSVNDLYEIHSIDPRITFGVLLQTMRQHKVPALMTLMGFQDADLEEFDASSWTHTNCTLSKVATAANVFGGKQAIRTLLTGAGGFGQTPGTVRVDPNTQYMVSVPVSVVVGGPFSLVPYDVTHSAVISIVGYHSLKRAAVIQQTFVTPAGCNEVAFRYTGTSNADDAYWGRAHGPWKTSDTRFNLPSHIRQSAQVRKLMSASYQGSVTGAGILNSYDAASINLSAPYERGPEYEVRVDPYFANPAQLELRTISPQYEMYYEELRQANDIWPFTFTAAGESAPAVPDSFDLEFASMLYIRNLCKWALRNDGSDSEAAAILAEISAPEPNSGPLTQLERIYAQDADPSPPPIRSRNAFGGD